jgi:hypothetical protein
MPLIDHVYVVEQFSSAATNPSLGDSVLPRTPEAGTLGLDAEALYCVDHLVVEVCRAIEDQVTGDRIVGKGLTQLLDDPRAGRVLGDAAAQDSAAIMRDYEEAVQDAKSQRRHSKEVHCSNGFTVIAQKCCPPFYRLRTPWRLPHPAQDRPLGYVEAEHSEFAMNAWRTPRRVLGDQAEDEFSLFNADAPPARQSATPRKPPPIQLESSSMPAYDCLRLHDNQRLLPPSPQAPQEQPEQLV